MRCERCQGARLVPARRTGPGTPWVPCPECLGHGVADCCDSARHQGREEAEGDPAPDLTDWAVS